MSIDNFLDVAIEEIFSDRYSRYSKYIIQDRALPDARDGLKPVQRRILYSMFKEGNVFDKQFRKSAKTVGNVIGNYHPHGDTSVYDAMVRTSQNWKVNELLVLMHGNNGSIDGDSPAAMRYTEAKLSKYSEFLIESINEDTVRMIPNFDDTEMEPTVLPTRVPNLLINGASGISAGYATDIPPHNAYEVLSACIYFNSNSDATLSQLMKYVKGPDFPTKAIIQGVDQIKNAYKTGKGKIVLKAKYEIKDNVILFSELPYEVNKASLVQKIDLIRYDKKIEGITEVLDQSSRDILEVAVFCKKDANVHAILNYLFKYTDLQKNYNFNMVAINNRRPMLMGLREFISSFINHRKEVVLNRTEFRLKRARNRYHIIEGLIRAVDMLDEVIKVIRSSVDKSSSIKNLVSKFDFSEVQAEAIVMMQLYRLSNTDINELKEKKAELEVLINHLCKIIEDPDFLISTIDEELKKVREFFKNERKSEIVKEVEKIEFDSRDLIKDENVVVSVTKLGYIKRCTTRSYLASMKVNNEVDEDVVIENIKSNTRDNVLIFFNDGSFVNLSVNDINEMRFKDRGKHISSLCKINDNINVIAIVSTNQFKDYNNVVCTSSNGYVTNIDFTKLNIKEKNKSIFQKLKVDDEIVDVKFIANEDMKLVKKLKLLVLTSKDRFVSLKMSDIEMHSTRRVGKKLFVLNKNEFVSKICPFDKGVVLLSNKGGYFKVKPNIQDKPIALFTNLKSKSHKIDWIMDVNFNEIAFNNDDTQIVFTPTDFSLSKVGDKIKTQTKITKIDNIEIPLNF